MYHIPILLNESIDGLNIKKDGIYVDVTFGGGGHSKEILRRITTGKLFAFDRDADAKVNEIYNPNFFLFQANYRFFKNFLKYNGVQKIDGLIADLGVSSHQFDTECRGFSYRFESDLDMRMNTGQKGSADVLLNTYSEIQLCEMFSKYGEVENAKKLAASIVEYRKSAKIKTTLQLIEAIRCCYPKHIENKYLAKVFQALRIDVNKETEALKEMLLECDRVIKPKGRLVVITYHSLEDRLVKNYIKNGKFEGEVERDIYGNISVPFEAINRKVIVPNENEIKNNSRARSAKLRIAEKK